MRSGVTSGKLRCVLEVSCTNLETKFEHVARTSAVYRRGDALNGFMEPQSGIRTVAVVLGGFSLEHQTAAPGLIVCVDQLTGPAGRALLIPPGETTRRSLSEQPDAA